MDLEKVQEVEEETLRFLKRIREFKTKVMRADAQGQRMIFITGCKETAALRRASLDLTRALAKMRR
jgi:hypothetical protein